MLPVSSHPARTVDYRVMRVLEKELLSNPKPPRATKIATWLHDLRRRASADPWDGRGHAPGSYVWDHRDTVKPPGFKAGDYDAIRRQAVAYILELRQTPTK